MTIDEAIKHAEEVAEEKEAQAWESQLQEEYRTIKSCKECAEEHRQLAEWLRELKEHREKQPCEDCISRQAAIDELNKLKIYRPLDSDRYVISDCLNKIVNLPSVQPEKRTKTLARDCISRQAVLEIQAKYAEHVGATKFWQMRDDIRALPSVTPQPECGADMMEESKCSKHNCPIDYTTLNPNCNLKDCPYRTE